MPRKTESSGRLACRLACIALASVHRRRMPWLGDKPGSFLRAGPVDPDCNQPTDMPQGQGGGVESPWYSKMASWEYDIIVALVTAALAADNATVFRLS